MISKAKWRRISDWHTVVLAVVLISNFIFKYSKINGYTTIAFCTVTLYSMIISLLGHFKSR